MLGGGNNYTQHELHTSRTENSELRSQLQLLQRRLELTNDNVDRQAALLDQARDEVSTLRGAATRTQKRTKAVQGVLDTMARELRRHR